MSFRKYGGTNKLEKNNNLTVHSIVADTFTIKNAFLSVFIIDGDLKINGNAIISNTLTVKDQINVKTLDVSANATIEGTLYLDKLHTVFLEENAKMVGLNTHVPSATLDISSNKVQAFNLKTSNVNNRNIIARNASNNGIAVLTTGTTESAIQFYSSVAGNIDTSNNQGAIIKYTNLDSRLTLDSISDVTVMSKMTISDNATVTPPANFGETVLIYDKDTENNNVFFNNAYGNTSVRTGSALTIQSINNASNTFMNIVAPNKLGLQLGGGSYPKDPTRSMGVIDTYNPTIDVDATPAIIIVSGNTFTKYNSTIGFNTFAPKYNDYALDINGPLHLNNGEIKKTTDVKFRISTMGNYGTTYGIAIGAQGYQGGNILADFKHFPYITMDGGKNWEQQNPFNATFNFVAIANVTIFNKIHIYDTTRTIIGGNSLAFVLDSTTIAGVTTKTWRQALLDVASIGGMYASNPYKNLVYTGGQSTTNINNAIIRYGTIIQYTDTVISTNDVERYKYDTDASNVILTNTTITSMAGYGNKLIVVGGININKFTITPGTVSLTSRNTSTATAGSDFLSVRLVDVNNGVAVGVNIVTYTKNGGNTWTPATIPNMTTTTFNDVYLDGSMNAIVVGNGGIIYSSNDNYATWKIVDEDVLNASGIGSRIIDPTNNITSVFMPDSSTIILSVVKNTDGSTKASKLYYLNMPNIFNNKRNFLLDISGCVRMSGDMYINDGGNLISNNPTFNLLTTNVTTLNVGTSTLVLNLGGTNSQTINVGGLNTNNLNMSGANVTIGGVSRGNVLIGGANTSDVFIGGANTANVFIGGAKTGNIIIGGSGSGSIFGSLNVSALSIGNVTLANNLKTGNIYANSIVVTNNLDVSFGTLTIRTTNNSTSATTGSLVVYGGLGVAKHIYSSGNINSLSDINLSGNMYSTGKKLIMSGTDNISQTIGSNVINYTTGTGTMQISGGTSILQDLYIGGTTYIKGGLVIQGATQNLGGQIVGQATFNSVIAASPLHGNSNQNITYNYTFREGRDPSNNIVTTYNQNGFDSNSGALTTEGGFAVARDSWLIGNLRVDGGNNFVNNTTESINPTTGAFHVKGGVGIGGNTNIGGNVVIYNSIESISATTGALRIRGGVGIGGNTNIGGNIIVYSSVDSTSTVTGALQIRGGVGIGGNANVGGNVIVWSSIESISVTTGALQSRGGVGIGGNANVGGNVIVYSSIESLSVTTGALQIRGGVGITQNTNFGGNVIVYSSIESISATTGALQIRGGVGIAQNTNVGGNVIVYSSIESLSVTTGALQVRGGVGIGTNANVGGKVIVYSSIESLSATTGALQIIGGVGIGGNTNVGGNVIVWSSVDSTSTSTGALKIKGGVGIGGNTNIGGNIIVYSSVDSTSTVTGALQIIGGVGIGGNTNIGGNVIIYSTTASISTNTGALQVRGGLGVAGDIQCRRVDATTISADNFIAADEFEILGVHESSTLGYGALIIRNGGLSVKQNTNIGGNVIVWSSVDSTSTNTGALQVRGGVGIGGNTNIGGNLIVYSLTESINATTGALQIKGGVGIGGNTNIRGGITAGSGVITDVLTVGGAVNIFSPTSSVETTAGALFVKGGIALGGSIHAGGNVIVWSSVDSTSTSTGALQIKGGVGIRGNTNIGGNVIVYSSVDSTSTVTGALQIIGGVGIGRNTNIGGNVIIYSTTESISTSTGALQVRGGLGVAGDIQCRSVDATTISANNFIANEELEILSGYESNTLGEGALIIRNGGLSVKRNTNIGGNVIVWSSVNSTSTNTGALQVRGGVGIAKKLYVGDDVSVGGMLTTSGILQIGLNTGDTVTKSIFFGGTYGDNDYNHTVIENRIYTGSEQSELLLFKGNDTTDRIRLYAGEIRFDTHSDNLEISAGLRTVDNNNRMIILPNGNVGIGTSNPVYKLDVIGNLRVSGPAYVNTVNSVDTSGANALSIYNGSREFGLGLAAGTLKYCTAQFHKFYTGSSDATNGEERFRVNTTGVIVSGTLSTTGAASVAGILSVFGEDICFWSTSRGGTVGTAPPVLSHLPGNILCINYNYGIVSTNNFASIEIKGPTTFQNMLYANGGISASGQNISCGTLTTTGSATVTGTLTANAIKARDTNTDVGNRNISQYLQPANTVGFGFGQFGNDGSGQWADYIHFNSFNDGTGGEANLLMLKKTGIGMRIFQGPAWDQTSITPYTKYRDAVLTEESNANVIIGGTLQVGITGPVDGSTTAKSIFFGGTFGDNNADNTVIENRIYAASENSELLLFKGNDAVDRIRLYAGEIRFDTASSQGNTRTTDTNNRMIILSNGYVGIGTAAPGSLLTVAGIIASNGMTTTGAAAVTGTLNVTSTTTFGGKLTVSAGGASITGALTITSGSIVATAQSITCGAITCGAITCGAISCTILNTNGSTLNCGAISCTTITSGAISCTTLTTNGSTLNCGSLNSGVINTQNNNITCGTGTVSATTFNASSDKRIKTNITDISGSSLDILRKIQPREYTMIDTKKPRYGFIAQEVKQHIPGSVELTTTFIPSIYENAFVKGHTITLINKSTTDISNRKLKLRDISNGELIVNVSNIQDDKTFTINEDISQNKLQYMDIYGNHLDKQINNDEVVYKRGSDVYTGEVKQGLFVYGIEVDDFHSINHDTIWTVAVGATKEMDVQLQEARQTIKGLEERISAIERHLLGSGNQGSPNPSFT